MKTVSGPVREHDAAQGLLQTQEWLIRSPPVPVAVPTAVWPDPSWRESLADLVVAPRDAAGGVHSGLSAFVGRCGRAPRGSAAVALAWCPAARDLGGSLPL